MSDENGFYYSQYYIQGRTIASLQETVSEWRKKSEHNRSLYLSLRNDYNALIDKYNELSNKFNKLSNNFNNNIDVYNELLDKCKKSYEDYDELVSEYNKLLANRNGLADKYNAERKALLDMERELAQEMPEEAISSIVTLMVTKLQENLLAMKEEDRCRFIQTNIEYQEFTEAFTRFNNMDLKKSVRAISSTGNYNESIKNFYQQKMHMPTPPKLLYPHLKQVMILLANFQQDLASKNT